MGGDGVGFGDEERDGSGDEGGGVGVGAGGWGGDGERDVDGDRDASGDGDGMGKFCNPHPPHTPLEQIVAMPTKIPSPPNLLDKACPLHRPKRGVIVVPS